MYSAGQYLLGALFIAGLSAAGFGVLHWLENMVMTKGNIFSKYLYFHFSPNLNTGKTCKTKPEFQYPGGRKYHTAKLVSFLYCTIGLISAIFAFFGAIVAIFFFIGFLVTLLR